VGGLRDSDASGCTTVYAPRFAAECFAGVLEVQLFSASGLPGGIGITRAPDPYCVLSVGDSAWTSGVQRFTRTPVWDSGGGKTPASCARLFVRDPSSQALRVRVMDSRPLTHDGELGVGKLLLAPLCDGARHQYELPLLTGSGMVRLAVRFLTLEEAEKRDAAADGSAAMLTTAAALLPPAPAALLGAAANALASAAASEAAASDAEAAEHWEAPAADGAWAQLADAVPASPTTAAALPSDFEKLCFICHARTDTQVALWRAAPHRELVVAFRGTETSSLTDLLTDVRLTMRPYKPGGSTVTAAERSSDDSSGDGDAPKVHDGFLDAFQSVQARVFAALDEARGGRGGWRVLVTGHSLGGALATLFAAELAASIASGARAGFTAVSMVNFGSPRVGNAAFCDAYNALVPDSVRMVNGSDAVPTVPALLGYRHVENGVRVTAAGAVAREEPPVLPAEGAAAGVPGGAVIAGVAQLAAKALGDGNDGGQGTEVAAEVAVALASLVDSAAHEAHFEEQYLSALRAAASRELTVAAPASKGSA
jgi:hypothetical protein